MCNEAFKSNFINQELLLLKRLLGCFAFHAAELYTIEPQRILVMMRFLQRAVMNNCYKIFCHYIERTSRMVYPRIVNSPILASEQSLV